MRTPDAALRRLLALIAVVIVALFVIVQAINRPVDGDTETYRAEFSDVFGLRKNADVRIRGVQVGKITDLQTQRSGRPIVTFTVQRSHALTARDRLAVRFQSLVGMRYLAITEETTGPDDTLDPSRTIPMTMTSGAFDITALFNGLRPLLQGADPAVFNTFATNLLHLLQGDEGVGIGDVLGDVERLTTFAKDRKALISTIIGNLGVISDNLNGKSEIIRTLLDNLEQLFNVLDANLELIKGAFRVGSVVFPQVAEVIQHVFDLTLGGRDNISRRLLEVTPDSTALTQALSMIPTVLSNVAQQPVAGAADTRCSKGTAPVPGLEKVLLSGGRLTLCRN